MMLKIALVAAAGALAVTPALAMSKKNDPVLSHTGGPIPYAELQQIDTGGYNARSGGRHKHMHATATADAPAPAVAAVPDQADAPAAPAIEPTPLTPTPAPAVTPAPATPPAAPQ